MIMHKAYKTTRQSSYESIYLDDGTYISKEESIYIEEPIEVDIFKADVEQNMVFGWANVAVNKNGSITLDWQDDVIPANVLEKAAYNYVLKYRTTGEMHEGEEVGYLVESVMFTKEKQLAMGIPEGTVSEGWWVGFYIPDKDVVAKIKDGTYQMFSIQGTALRI